MEFYRAIVVNNNDPCKIGRVQLKVYGEHDDSDDVDTLPWAEVSQSPSIGLVGGVGISSVLRVGTWVYVVKLEDTETRYLVLGVCVGVQGECGDVSYGEKGVSDFAQMCVTEDNLNNKASGNSEKVSDGSGFRYVHTVNPGDYLNSTVFKSEAGILVEFNDGMKLIKITHPSGSTVLIDDSGVSITSLGNAKIITKGDLGISVKQNANITVDGDMNLCVKGDMCCNVDGNMTQSVSGDWDLKCSGTLRQFGYTDVLYNIKGDFGIKDTNFNVESQGGNIKFVDIITPRGVDLSSHVHSGVRRGDSNTDIPK